MPTGQWDNDGPRLAAHHISGTGPRLAAHSISGIGPHQVTHPVPGQRRAERRNSGASPRRERTHAAGASGLEGLAACALLLLILVFGGGTRNDLFSDLFVQLCSIPLLLFAFYQLDFRRLPRAEQQWLCLLAALASLPLIYLIPLPAVVWSWLPGRDDIAALQTAHGLGGSWSRSLSLDPVATWAALRALLPALALGLLVPRLDTTWRRRLLYLVILAGVFTVPLGLAQINGGTPSPLRFYTPTNVHDAVGLFANRNHFAALLVAGLALCGGFLVAELAQHPEPTPQNRLRVTMWILLAAVLVFGLALSRSRAGVGLGGLALAACAWFAWRRLGSRVLRFILIGAVLVVLLGFQVGFVWMVERAQQMFAGDHRWQILGASLDLAREFAWLGVGPGAFPAAYAAFEPIASLGPKIINHAHNDWLEWFLEVGLLLPLAAFAFLAWLGARTRELRRLSARGVPGDIQSTATVDQREADAALYLFGPWLAILLALLHAAFDYQLRTTMDLSAFVICCACLLPPRAAVEPSPRSASVRRLRSVPGSTDGPPD